MGGTVSKPDPSRQLEVIAAGYPRTGTSSLQIALEKLLEGPAYHGGSQVFFSGDDARVKLWAQASDAKFRKKDKQLVLKYLAEATKGFVAQFDSPSIFFIPELVELYPEAKVVLTTRDPEKWWSSFSMLLGHIPWYYDVLTAVRPAVRWSPAFLRAFRITVDDMVVGAGYKPEEYGPHIIELHNQQVRDCVPKERLLEMEIGQGWEPLAKFLGKPIPDESFPNINERAAFDRQATIMTRKLMLTWLGILTVPVATGYYVWSWMSSSD